MSSLLPLGGFKWMTVTCPPSYFTLPQIVRKLNRMTVMTSKIMILPLKSGQIEFWYQKMRKVLKRMQKNSDLKKKFIYQILFSSLDKSASTKIWNFSIKVSDEIFSFAPILMKLFLDTFQNILRKRKKKFDKFC